MSLGTHMFYIYSQTGPPLCNRTSCDSMLIELRLIDTLGLWGFLVQWLGSDQFTTASTSSYQTCGLLIGSAFSRTPLVTGIVSGKHHKVVGPRGPAFLKGYSLVLLGSIHLERSKCLLENLWNVNKSIPQTLVFI